MPLILPQNCGNCRHIFTERHSCALPYSVLRTLPGREPLIRGWFGDADSVVCRLHESKPDTPEDES